MISLAQALQVQNANANIAEIVRAAYARDDDDTITQVAADALQSNRVKMIDYPDGLLYAGLGPFELVAVSRWQKENQPRDVKSRTSHSIDREHSAL